MPPYSRLLRRFTRTFALVLLAAGAAGTAFGQLLYVPNYGNNSVGAYSVSAGGITLLACQSPNPITTNLSSGLTPGTLPIRLAMSTANGGFLYASDLGGSITAYAVSPTGTACPGALTPLTAAASGCPLANGETCPVYANGAGIPHNVGTPRGIAVDPTGHYLYVANSGTGNISAFTIGSNGALTTIAGSPFAITSVNSLQNLTVSGTTLYATLGAAQVNNVAAIPIIAGGALNTSGITYGTVPSNDSGTGWDDPPGSSPADLVASGGFLYVTDLNADPSINPPLTHGITVFVINGNGTLTYSNSFGTGTNPDGLGINSAGTLLYVANNGDNTVQVFSVSGSVLTPGATLGSGSSPIGVAVDPATGTVYVSNNGDGTVSEYSGGLASTIGTSPVVPGSQPQFLLGHTSRSGR